MKKILFIASHRKDRSPSQRFRFEQYFDFLAENGFSCELSYLISKDDDQFFYKPGNYFKKLGVFLRSHLKRRQDVRRAAGFDIIFIQREAFMTGTTKYEKAFAKKAKVVFDFDDSIWLQNISSANKVLAVMKNPEKTSQLIAVADLIFAGNPFLAEYASTYNKNIHIVPTTIDTVEYSRILQPPSDKICIGWSGSITTIEHFESALPAFLKIKEKYGDKIFFRVIGDGNYKNEALGIQGLPWRKDTEISDLSRIDIGLMPLPITNWAKGKCGLKGLQYMALGIPTIMSPIGVNTDIIQDGENGYLALSVDEWVEKISNLIDSAALRANIGEKGRNTVLEKYSVEANKKLYLAHFEKLISQ